MNPGPLEIEAGVIINYKVLGAGKLQNHCIIYGTAYPHSGVMKGKHQIKMAHENFIDNYGCSTSAPTSITGVSMVVMKPKYKSSA